MTAIDPHVLALYRCPLTRSPLRQEGDWLVAEQPEGAGLRYPIRGGIPVLLMDQAELPEGVETLDGFKQKYAGDVAS
ncbi:MAG: Trm112 family protein [Planctomycetota bacterium]